MKTLHLAAAAALLTSLTACGGGDDAAGEPATTATVTVTVTSDPAAEATTPSEPPTSEVPKTDGQTGARLTSSFGTLEVLDFNPEVTTDPSGRDAIGDERWSAALVRTCVHENYSGEPVQLSWSPWTMEDADGGQYLSVDAVGGISYPTPVYPQLGDRTTRNGQCVKGWVTFDTSGAGQISTVVYEPDGEPAPLVWELR